MTQEEIIWTLVINTVSIILGGGLIGLWIDWRRHQRELRQWAKEDKQLEIDIPRADMRVWRYQLEKHMGDKEKLQIYEGKLEGTVEKFLIVVQFAVRSTTNSDVILTSYSVDVPSLLEGWRVSADYYDLDKDYEKADPRNIESLTLRPYGSISRLCVITSKEDIFAKSQQRLEDPPKTVSVTATLSTGAVVQTQAALKVLESGMPGVGEHKGDYYPIKYFEKENPDTYITEVDEIPF